MVLTDEFAYGLSVTILNTLERHVNNVKTLFSNKYFKMSEGNLHRLILLTNFYDSTSCPMAA